MTFRDRLGLGASPLVLRLVLGVTFLWAGLGKAIDFVEVSGEPASLLRSLGVSGVPKTPEAPAPRIAPPTFDGPERPLPPPPPEEPARETTGPAPLAALSQPAVGPALTPTEPLRVPKAMLLALLVHHAATPGVDAGGAPIRALAPAWAGRGRNPVMIAWAATITEISAGSLLLVGLLTRLSASALGVVMVAAAWLTELGPALQSGSTRWGVLPSYAPFDHEAWTPLVLQFVLGGAALALVLAGPGSLSLDRLLLGRSREID